eukprot:TRINITY_DN10893_c0_g1_i4.p1 TRINITY_DN10893_c0_g1~~TRINITY_DN10893_c0_g1_i4.p1  ORF type:complete len:197 (+),score=75.06 TRINITY_DN10893_c0_g1_i4:78-668(+)
MGCCHSNVPSREEELPPKRQEDRNQRDHASASNDLLGDGAGETVQGDLLPYGQEDGVKDDDKYAVDDALDQLLANGWRYFIVDSHQVDIAAGDSAEDIECDWTFSYTDKLAPPGGFAAPGKAMFGAGVPSISPKAGLALLQSLRPPAHNQHHMIEISSQMVAPLLCYQLPAAQQDTPLVADVKVEQLLANDTQDSE